MTDPTYLWFIVFIPGFIWLVREMFRSWFIEPHEPRTYVPGPAPQAPLPDGSLYVPSPVEKFDRIVRMPAVRSNIAPFKPHLDKHTVVPATPRPVPAPVAPSPVVPAPKAKKPKAKRPRAKGGRIKPNEWGAQGLYKKDGSVRTNFTVVAHDGVRLAGR